ncbi:uncharacterized protein A1O9_06255 [Exophiala aquamarina CBS 119918]|uniref:Uncharacterized protein n=1 Tax=Exophiala aquamarina CBS 119918 TaxID=1182545 RepID=A0A072PE24_9EURO|nr:uncharacterized protein A1O9_06255 [Exophiala aquamarina CBS 119918]KEF58329.1 hypothetical protein A1O9_06255 [Exophiala aquamarina CBS 119918]
MDQAAGISSSGTTIAAILQHWSQRASPRTAGAVPLADVPPQYENRNKDFTIGVREVPSSSGTDSTYIQRSQTEQPLKRWPQEPQPITNEPVVERFLDFFDVILCILPCALLIKAGLCVLASRLDAENKGPYIDKASQLTVKLIQFNEQLTTIFTIIFILIVSTTVRRFALWRAEKGATIGELEQLHASISLPATLKAIWSLRAFTFTSLGLVFVWTWYYAGSQASTREYSYQDSSPLQQVDVAFLGSQATSAFQNGIIDTLSPVRKTDMTARYHMYSQFTAGTQKANSQDAKSINGADIYGATLTPWYGPTRGGSWADLEFDKDGWLEIREMSTQPVVSSIGTSLYRRNMSQSSLNEWYPSKMIGSYTYNTSHFQANCTAPLLSTNSTRPVGLLPVLSTGMNMSAPSSDPSVPRELSFWHYVNSTASLEATCSMSRINVEIEAHCTAAICKPTRMRKFSTELRTLLDDDSFAQSFFNSMMVACGMPTKPGDFSTFDNDNGISDLRNDINLGRLNDPAALAAATSVAQFPMSMAITRFINTYFTASQVLLYEHDFQDDLAINGSIALNQNPDFSFLSMDGAKFEPQYSLSWPWLAVDCISNSVLLAAAVFAFWLRKKTLAPDIFGFVSSLTRDNPNLQLPDGGSTLSGIDRSRRMKHVKVKIGDVGTAAEVGRVGLTALDDGNPLRSPRDLEKGRCYQ